MNIMNSIAKGLTEEGIQAVSTYLAGQEPCEVKIMVNHEEPDFIDK